MSKPESSPITITPYQLWTWLLYSLRYALGRRSVACSETAEILLEFFPRLTRHQQIQIITEIRDNLESAENSGSTLGDPIDHTLWVVTAVKLEERVHDSE